ncbi:MAG TPA: phosphoribosylanthranilate isomerase, partial [Dehalococcoidia bacterium]|nr:phosphoribosylanthranilate isomerase [Dehalococcoidia bacterium]
MPAEAMPPLVKICGISEPQHARAAASLGADFIGIVFAPSRRQVTMGQAVKIADALGKDRGSTPSPLAATPGQIEERLRLQRPLLVGVFADQDVDTINTIAEQCSLDLVQLNGSEPWDICRLIQRPVLKAVKLPESATLEEALDRMGDGAIPLLDASVEGLYGGTGQRLD